MVLCYKKGDGVKYVRLVAWLIFVISVLKAQELVNNRLSSVTNTIHDTADLSEFIAKSNNLTA